jgi:hypothetical protein
MLKKLQADFAKDLIHKSNSGAYLNSEFFRSDALIQVYHHQYFLSLTTALAKTYSCVQRLVGEDFFKFLAREFIQKYHLKSPSIIDYGSEFADFLQTNPSCQKLKFLPEIAEFEWLYKLCYFSADGVFLMNSKYPVIKIWQLDETSAQLDLSSGGDYLKIAKKNAKVIVEKLTKREYENEKNN